MKMKINEKITRIMDRKGISVREFEVLTGLSTTLAYTLMDKDTVRLGSVRQICQGISVSLAEVFREGEDLYELEDSQMEELQLFSLLFPEKQEYVIEYFEKVLEDGAL